MVVKLCVLVLYAMKKFCNSTIAQIFVVLDKNSHICINGSVIVNTTLLEFNMKQIHPEFTAIFDSNSV